jgi:beta-ureidopropionase / N-carbamoyl-L-amino-acid hydrolase
VHFDPACIAAARLSASTSGFTARDKTSGAAHDAAYVARVAAAATIFVPCRGGISHNESEF